MNLLSENGTPNGAQILALSQLTGVPVGQPVSMESLQAEAKRIIKDGCGLVATGAAGAA